MRNETHNCPTDGRRLKRVVSWLATSMDDQPEILRAAIMLCVLINGVNFIASIFGWALIAVIKAAS